MQSLSNYWQDHKNSLRSYIAKRVRQSDVVDDLLQDTYLKAHANIQSLKSSASIGAWLYRIAANVIVDYYRNQQTWQFLDDLQTDVAQPEREKDYIRELAISVKPLIALLPELYREALTLAEIDGLPQAQIADRLGISLSGAKSRVQRGREKLRDLFLQCCDIEQGPNGITGYTPRADGCACDYTPAELLRLFDAITVYQSTAQLASQLDIRKQNDKSET